MSRKGSKKRRYEVNRNFSDYFLDPFSDLVYDKVPETYKKPLPEVDFLGDRPTSRRITSGNIVTYQVKKPKYKSKTSINDRVAFKSPRRTVVCIRRRARREVLFSKRKIGKGVKVSKLRRYTPDSKIKC